MADGHPTKVWGSKTLPLQFGNRRFQFSLLLTDVDRPILGADFLAEFNLLVDASKRQVLERASMKPLSSHVMSIPDPAVASVFKLAPDGQVWEVSEVLEVLEVPEVLEVSDSSLPSPFPTSTKGINLRSTSIRPTFLSRSSPPTEISHSPPRLCTYKRRFLNL